MPTINDSRNFIQDPRYVTCALAGLRACALASLSPGPSLSACSSLDHLRPCSLARLRFPHRSMRTAMNRPAMYSSASRRRLHRLRSAGLMFTICNVLNVTIPTGPAIAARVPLVRSWAAPASCNDRRSQGPGARRGSVYLRRA